MRRPPGTDMCRSEPRRHGDQGRQRFEVSGLQSAGAGDETGTERRRQCAVLGVATGAHACEWVTET